MAMKKPRRSTSRPCPVVEYQDTTGEIERAIATRHRAFRGDATLREICEANGLTEDAFVREAHLLPSLDLFMSGVRDLRGLSHFGGLTAFCLINVPNITSLSGLDACCPGLESVNITECGLTTMDGLEGLTALTALHLSSNHLQSLEGVRNMTRLRKLWANDNRIKSIDGLSGLQALEELWLCRNGLTEIGDNLPLGPALSEINLAHNRLGYFKELLKLAPLAGLRSLTLQDPHFGDNPVCSLSNYRTYVAYHLTQLTSLDMAMVSEESKTFANTVFLKKSMYYNMRSRIVKRHAGHVIRKAAELCVEKASELQTTLIHLQWQSKHVERRLITDRTAREAPKTADTKEDGRPDDHDDKLSTPVSVAEKRTRSRGGQTGILKKMERATGSANSAHGAVGNKQLSSSRGSGTEIGSEALQLTAKGQALARAVVVVDGVLHKMEQQLDTFKQVVGRACKRAVSELMLEFDTGGNVRFEEGRPGDVWFSSCADLVKSRVQMTSGNGSAPGVKVSRVVRIHNRFLKNRFERCVREATADKDKGKVASSAVLAAPPASSCTPAVTVSMVAAGASGTTSEGQNTSPKEGKLSPCSQSSQATIEGSDSRYRHQVRGGNGEDDVSPESPCSEESGTPSEGDVWKRGLSGPLQEPEKGNSVAGGERANGHDPEVVEEEKPNNGDTVGVGNSDANIPPGHLLDSGDLSRGGGRPTNAGGRKGDKRSVPAQTRSLQYLFFTTRKCGAGLHWGNKTASDGGQERGSDNDGTDEGGDCEQSLQPDLLKLAEDGFRIRDWSETDVANVKPPAERAHGPAQPETGRNATTGAGDNRGAPRACCRPPAVVLCSHLSEADVLGMGGGAELATAAAGKCTPTVAPPASVGISSSGAASPACRVLVVKVYTGRSQCLPFSGEDGVAPEPSMLGEAWASGFKSVCVSSSAHGKGGDEGGGGDTNSPAGASSRYQEWHVLDGALALPEYIIEFDISPEMGEAGQAIKDGVRQRVTKWKHELAPSSRSTSLSSSSLSLASSPAATVSNAATGKTGGGSGGSGGRATERTDVLPFLISLARLARQLEIDAASYTLRYEAGISRALRMQPSAPALGMPHGGGSVGASGVGSGGIVDSEGVMILRDQPTFTMAARSGRLLTRLSLHGQGVRSIEGLEACENLQVLILSFNEISRLQGLVGLGRLEHLDLGYNVIEGVHRHHESPQTPDEVANGGGSTAALTSAPSIAMRNTTIHLARDTEGSDGHPEGQKEACVEGKESGVLESDVRGSGADEVAMFPSLTRLDLNNNILHDLDDLQALWQLAPSLAVLDMRGNPLRTARTFRGAAIRGIPGLKVLDGQPVTRKEASLRRACRSLTLDMLRRNGRTRAPRSGPHRTTVHNGRPAGDGVAFDVGDYRQKPAHSTSNIDSDEQQKQQQQQHQAAASPGGEFDPEACGQEKRHVSTHLRGRTGESRDHYSVSGDMKAEEETNDSTSAGGVVDVGAAGEGGEHHEIPPLGNETGPKPRKPSTAAATGASRGGRTSSNATSSDGRPNSAPATETGAVAPIGALEQGGGDGVVSDDDCTPKGGGLALESIELVNLHNLSLHKLEGMERLTRLRVADLSGNELHDTAPLRSCACLEDLNLEGNELTTAGLLGLVGLQRLVKLDLGYNQISDLHPLGGLTGLSQLSLESNLLHNLRGLSKLVNLMELYCGNNDIAATSEVERLQALPRLIILDTSGNPVCSSRCFRLLVLYKIPKLKVLDGVGVGGTETAEAKFTFIGKLTEDVIWNKYDADKVETLKYLDLSRSKWRTVEVLPTLPFRCLQELNLDSNSLASFATLGGLPSLGVLRLSHNRIDSIGQAEGAASNGTSAVDEECIFVRLEVLYLGFNRICDIAALCLERMPRLLAVDLQGNSIGNLAGLNRCHTLVEVNLDGNKIRQLGPPSALNGLGNLRKLRLEDNGLRALAPGLAASTPALLSLSLAQNRLADPAELDRLGALPNLMELSVCGNPMARRPYSRLALLALFPSLAAVDCTDITPEEKRLSEALAGKSCTGLMPPSDGAGISNGVSGGGVGGGASAGGTGVTPAGGGSSRRDYVTVGNIGSIVRKSPAEGQWGGLGGYPTGPTGHSFSPFRPQESLPPPNKSVAPSGERGGRVTAGDECFVQAITLKSKTGPASSGVSIAESAGAAGEAAVGGQTNRGSQPHHGSNAKWASLSTTRRIGKGGGVKRPLKLTSMNFSTTPEDERGVNRGGQRNIGGAGLTGVGNIGGNAGDRGSSGRACLGGGASPERC